MRTVVPPHDGRSVATTLDDAEDLRKQVQRLIERAILASERAADRAEDVTLDPEDLLPIVARLRKALRMIDLMKIEIGKVLAKTTTTARGGGCCTMKPRHLRAVPEPDETPEQYREGAKQFAVNLVCELIDAVPDDKAKRVHDLLALLEGTKK